MLIIIEGEDHEIDWNVKLNVADYYVRSIHNRDYILTNIIMSLVDRILSLSVTLLLMSLFIILVIQRQARECDYSSTQ